MGSSILDIKIEGFSRSFDIGTTGCLRCAKAVLPSMVANKSGCIIVTGATASFRGSAKGGTFAASKMALRGLTQSMAREFAPKNIHVAHIRIDCAIDSEKSKGWFGDKYHDELLGRPDDLAETYLAVAKQSKFGWSNEVELRPFLENWSL